MTPDEIYDRYGEKMFHYAALRLGSAQDAEDVLQEAFYRLSRYAIRWPFIRNPKAFVFKVLRNETNRFLGRKSRGPMLMNLEAARNQRNAVAPGNTAATCMVSAKMSMTSTEGCRSALSSASQTHGEEKDDILSRRTAAALSALPDEQREVVILKIFQDMSFKEIASVCGLSINTAASRYRYALEKLRAAIGREE